MKTALILAGAGARGIIQAGMIKAFVDNGFQYDALYGSSAGALNGALLHAGQVDEMVDLWLNIRNKDVYRYAPWNAFIKGRGCLYDSTPLRKLIERTVNVDRMQLNERQFNVNVTDAHGYLSVRFVFGRHACGNPISAVQALWASASPPILMPPVPTCMGPLTDGGITNNYSIMDAVQDGADRLVIMAPMIPEPRQIRTIVDAIDMTVSIQIWNQLQRELKFVQKLNSVDGYRKIQIISITVDRATGIGILDFDLEDRKELLGWGSDLAAKALGCQLAKA